MSDLSTCESSEMIWRNLCRFCGAQHYKDLDSPLNEIFLDVVDKLFSFSAETLNVFKICTNCQIFIESICKFYNQVKNVSQIFCEIEKSIKDDVPINIVQLNSKYSFQQKKTEDIGNLNDIADQNKKKTANYESNTDENAEKNNNCNENQACKTKHKGTLLTNLTRKAKPKNNDKHKAKDQRRKIQSKQKYKCETCGKKLSTNSNLIAHAKLHWPTDKKESKFFKCPHCDLRYPREERMLNHVRMTHLKQRPYKCEDCGKGFTYQHHVMRHQRNVHGKREGTCPICKKKFPSSRIKAHIENHNKDCLACSICGDLLKSNKSLKRHMLIHSDVKNSICNYCEKGFKRSESLRLHMITHTDFKPFLCRFCGHSFVYQTNRKKHEQTMHPNEYKKKEKDIENDSYENDLELPSIEQLFKILEDLKDGKEINFIHKKKIENKN